MLALEAELELALEVVVALAEAENPLLALDVEPALELELFVTGAEWVCITAVPFSVHRLVKVVNWVSLAEVVGADADVVMGDTTEEPPVVAFALFVALPDAYELDMLELDTLELLKLDEDETELLELAERELDETELVVVAFALMVGMDKEADEDDEEDELSGMVVTGCEWTSNEPLTPSTVQVTEKYAAVKNEGLYNKRVTVPRRSKIKVKAGGRAEMRVDEVGPTEGEVAFAEMEKLRLALGLVALIRTDELTPVPVGPTGGVVAFAEMEKLRLALVAVELAVTGAECVCKTVVPFSVHRLVKVVKLVGLTLGVVAFTTTDELVIPVPVGPTVGVVAFAVIEKPLLALPVVVALPVGPTEGVVALAVIEKPLLAVPVDVALPVTGAEWVWSTVVPFSVHRLVNVVKLVGLNEVTVVVALAEAENPLLALDVEPALELELFVTGAEWVCITVVPFSVHRLVKVVNWVPLAEVVGADADVVIGDTTEEPPVVAFALFVALPDAYELDMLELNTLEPLKLDEDETELLELAERELDETELVVVAFALMVGMDKEADEDDEEDELSGMVVTGCDTVQVMEKYAAVKNEGLYNKRVTVPRRSKIEGKAGGRAEMRVDEGISGG
ncbi:hypothetical protein B0A55_03417 [Friedmanniomyces simplex]|uniref:Uncharacterized protein n=1 Tax=Friedmanniomyces simplex TaxID=329884 RepID=A0A4U0XJH9_9PEZI|nr:hypothetical protein B0A55_03417 [Friedmanniomyces simplex]